jgi:hypothetical protein
MRRKATVVALVILSLIGAPAAMACQYCYMTPEAPYANCFDGAPGLNFPMYANCDGGQYCYKLGRGVMICNPECYGIPCVTV